MVKDDAIFAIRGKALVFVCCISKSLQGELKKKRDLYLSFVLLVGFNKELLVS